MGHKHLTYTARIQIEAWSNAKVPAKVMAENLGVHISTIYRELKRGTYEHLNSDYTMDTRYSADIAENKYREHLTAKGTGLKIGNDHEYAAYIEYMISVKKYSPDAVLGEIKCKGLKFNTTVSRTTLYRYINDGIFLTISNADLPIKKNKGKKKKEEEKRGSRAPRGTSIEQRPKSINNREDFGHWEMDCVEGKKKTKKTVLALTERKSRWELFRLMPSKTTESVVKQLDKIEKQIGTEKFKQIFKTITVDNGSEFMDVNGIERSVLTGEKRTQVYYCHPYCSSERGSNENQNRMLRRHHPKGTDFTHVTDEEIQQVEDWLNNYPRKMFGFYSSADVAEAWKNSMLEN